MNAPTTLEPDSDDAELAPIIESLGYAMRPINVGARQLTEELGLGPRGAFMLTLISRGIRFPKDLAAVLKTPRSLITADLGRLKKAGLVTASSDDPDRRKSVLSLTPAGDAARQAISDEIVRIVAANLARYSRSELRLFARMLRDVRGPDDPAVPMRLKPTLS